MTATDTADRDLTTSVGTRVLTVSGRVHAPADEIFALLADPSRHPSTDATGTLRGPVDGDQSARIRSIGDVFAMNMHAEVMGGDYVMENHVTDLQEGRRIAWMPASVGREPHGVRWTWVLDPVSDGETDVTLQYDWELVTDPKFLARREFPTFPPRAFEASFRALAAAVEGAAAPDAGGGAGAPGGFTATSEGRRR